MQRPCPSCGADVPDDTTFCPTCNGYVAWHAGSDEEVEAESPRLPGEEPQEPPPPPPDETTELPPVETAGTTCPDCGHDNPMTWSLCQRCGAPLHAAPSPEPPAPEPPAPEPTAPEPPAPEPSGPPRGLWIGLGLLALLGVVALGVVLLTGDDDPPTAPAPGPSPAVTERPFIANTEPDTEEPAGTGVLVDVQVARGEGFDEIGFVVEGPGVGWTVEYVEEPRQQGSGNPVEVRGDTVLHVLLQPLEQPQGTVGTLELTATTAMVELVDASWFEGQWQFFVGLEGPPLPFRMIPDGEGGALLQVDTTGAG